MVDFVPQTGGAATRAAVSSVVRSELDSLGDRLAAAREAADGEIERLAAFRWVTELAGMRPAEVAELTGVSRQTLTNLRSAERGANYQWPTDLRILLELGLQGPRRVDDLIATIARVPTDEHQVTDALGRLVSERLVAEATLTAAAPNAPDRSWRLTTAGIEDLPRRLRHAAMPPSRTWTAYVVSSPGEANAIVAAGERALGEHGAAVIPARTVAGQDHPEVAFFVEAFDAREAERAAAARFSDLRARAGMSPRNGPVVVSALVPPRRSA